MKLFLVNIRGGSSTYVVADGLEEAYEIYRRFLEEHNLLLPHQRALHIIELLAEEGPCPECGKLLFVKRNKEEEE